MVEDRPPTPLPPGLAGSVHLILGGAGGIGSALARQLVAAGARVLLAGRRAEPLAALGAELGAAHAVADATRFAEVEAVAARAVEELGRLDGIACCAGSLLLKPAHLTSEEELEQTLAANVRTAFAAVRAGARSLSPGGAIALCSSAAARLGLPNHEAIAAAKAAVEGLVRSAAATYAPRLRVNAVAPGLVRTPLASRITASEPALRASTALHAMGRVGEAEDVARALAFLLDPAQSWVTGQVVGVDGGLGAVRGRG